MLLLLSLLACTPKAVETRLTSLEMEVAQLQGRVAVLEGEAPDPETREQAAVALFEQLTAATEGGEVAQAKQLGAQLDEQYAGTRAQQAAQRILSELRLVGEPAVALDVEEWIQGYASITEGAWVVVFFEQWCPHCQREIPALQAQLDDFQAAGFQVVGATQLTRGSTLDETRDFLARSGVSFPVAKVGETAASAYQVRGIPAAVVVSDGVILWRGHPAGLTPTLLHNLTLR